eukprot:scaffold2650_cov218-Chaetoceros_neogracile.AAC.1
MTSESQDFTTVLTPRVLTSHSKPITVSLRNKQDDLRKSRLHCLAMLKPRKAITVSLRNKQDDLLRKSKLHYLAVLTPREPRTASSLQ